MRYFIVLFFSIIFSGCNDSVKEIELFEQVDKVIAHRSDGYGVREDLNANSFVYTSHVIDYIHGRDCEKHFCKKVISYLDDTAYLQDKATKYEFYLTVNKYNFIDPPFHIIIFQDWVRIDPDDRNGNHPITTLDLKPVDGGISLAHYDNAWQFDYGFDNPFDIDDPTDALHNHDYKRFNGSTALNVGQEYKVELVIYDDEKVKLIVDNKLISEAFYKTKSLTENHIQQFGMYWYRNYNTNINNCESFTSFPENACKSNSITIRDFKVLNKII